MKKNFLNNKEFIFIDFDGTIKQSDDVKAKAFIKIFENKINDTQKKRIANHHYENLGVSRFVKIPLYLKWSGIKQTKKNTVKYSRLFSKIVINRVCSSKWVLGAKKFITLNQNKKIILVTATPNKEIIKILKKLKIYDYFYKIYGSPIIKSEIVKNFLNFYNSSQKNYIYIGNSLSDYYAAEVNKIFYINIGKLKNLKKKYIFIKNFKTLNDLKT